MMRCLGQWNAYCAAGATLAERRARLEEVPAELRDQVRSHLRTIWELKKRAAEIKIGEGASPPSPSTDEALDRSATDDE